MRFTALGFLFGLVLLVPAIQGYGSPLLNSDQQEHDPVFLLDVPFVYGEQAFQERISQGISHDRQPIGLVLSGGSARAFAHIGVLQYLEEQEIVPDYIVTNSMGSIVGLLYAAGFSPDQIYRIISETQVGYLFRPGFPSRGGLSDVSNFLGLVEKYTGNPNIEELPIPILVLAEDIRTRRQVIMIEGPFITVMQAAFALPVFFPPVPYGPHLLVDGGITNLVPMGWARKYSDALIASTTFYNNPDLNLGNPLTVLSVSMDIFKARTGVSEVKQTNPMLIRSGVEHFSFMDFDRLHEISAIGYTSAQEQFQPDLPWISLARTDSRTKLQELRILRESHELSISSTLNHIGAGRNIEKMDPMGHLFPRFLSWGNPEDVYRLRNGYFFGLDGEFGFQGFFGHAYAGGWNEFGSLNPLGTLGVRAGWFHGQKFMLSGTVFGNGTLAGELHSLYFNGLGEFYLPSLSVGGGFIWEQTEVFLESEVPASSDLQSLWINGFWNLGQWTGVRLELGATRHNDIFGFGNTVVYLRLPGGLRYENKNFGAYSFTGNSVQTFPRDGLFTSAEPERFLFSQRSGLFFDVESFRPSFAELLILRDLRLGVFGEVVGYGQMNWSAGVQGKITLSLIGLTRFTLETYGGYDGNSSAPTWGIFVVGSPPVEQ